VKTRLLKGSTVGAKQFKVHLDGYNQVPVLRGEAKESIRQDFVYFDDDGHLVAYRDERFKYTFSRQDAKGMEIWRNPLTNLRAPIMIDLRTDPFEYAPDGSANYEKWVIARAFLILPAVAKVTKYLETYREFPPRQKPASFSIDQVIEKLNASIEK
jgi:arylsulfatase